MTTVRCLFCGKIEPWWTCDCRAASEVRAGNRAHPVVTAVYAYKGGRATALSTTIAFEGGGYLAQPVEEPASPPPPKGRAAYMREYRKRS